MKLRIKFSKHGSMKFVGHLDIMRYFQKALRRAEIDVALTDGFSPHQKMSFALPLGLGLCSNGEYFDVQLNSYTTPENVMKRLDKQMNDEIKILSVTVLEDKAGKAMSMVKAADYSVVMKEEYLDKVYEIDGKTYTGRDVWDSLINSLPDFLLQKEIIVLKKTKKSEREIDIKPLIYYMSVKEIRVNSKENKCIFLKVSQGSENNLKPEMVIEQMCKYIKMKMDIFAYQYTREELYSYDEEKIEYIPLGDYGERFVNEI